MMQLRELLPLLQIQEISDVEDLSQYELDDPQNTITLTTADGDTTLQVGMESSK